MPMTESRHETRQRRLIRARFLGKLGQWLRTARQQIGDSKLGGDVNSGRHTVRLDQIKKLQRRCR
jgi:hypothetical protein